jgi:D-glycero-beta-D-manno-heptose 1-phosphate adenylyltransferase
MFLKLKNWNEAAKQVQSWKNQGLEVVFTNGCFDILHFGHIAYLQEAKAKGNKLVIGLNSDASVQILKGVHRPINDQKSRIAILDSLSFVDLVVVFEEETPLELITLLVPDILVKGGDYTIDKIVGANVVLENGGQVLSLQFVEGYSTTNLEQKIIAHAKK